MYFLMEICRRKGVDPNKLHFPEGQQDPFTTVPVAVAYVMMVKLMVYPSIQNVLLPSILNQNPGGNKYHIYSGTLQERISRFDKILQLYREAFTLHTPSDLQRALIADAQAVFGYVVSGPADDDNLLLAAFGDLHV